MQILVVSSFLPYPLFSGGHIRLFNLIRELSKMHNITLICEKRDYQKEAEISEVKKFCRKVITVPRKKQWTLKNILKTGLSFSPFLITGHTNKQMQKEIIDLLGIEKFDLIHVETSYVLQNIPSIEIPLVLVEHNVEYLVYKRFADRAPLMLRPLLYIDVLKLKYWEEKMWDKATKLVAVSEFEKKVMEKIRKDVEVVPNGVDLDKFKIGNLQIKIGRKEKRILFIGDFKWLENRDALEWILKEIWPLIMSNIKNQKSNIDVRLWIVGRKIPESVKQLTDDANIIFDENAPAETSKIYQNADILIAPIRVGGGTSFKILEGMASGLPVVTTPLGNAISAKESQEILIAKDALDFAQKTLDVLKNKILYEKISRNSRKLIEEKFAWEKIAKKLDQIYQSVV